MASDIVSKRSDSDDRGLSRLVQSLGINNPTYYLSQDYGRFLENDFDVYDP